MIKQTCYVYIGGNYGRLFSTPTTLQTNVYKRTRSDLDCIDSSFWVFLASLVLICELCILQGKANINISPAHDPILIENLLGEGLFTDHCQYVVREKGRADQYVVAPTTY